MYTSEKYRGLTDHIRIKIKIIFRDPSKSTNQKNRTNVSIRTHVTYISQVYKT